MIFGNWGFPAWGVTGAATATTIALWCKAAVYLTLFLRRQYREKHGTVTGCRFDAARISPIAALWLPQRCATRVRGHCVHVVLVDRRPVRSALELAATSLAFNVNTLAFMPVYGIGIATTTLVGQRIGQGRPRLAERGVWSAFTLAALYTLAVARFTWQRPIFCSWLMARRPTRTDFEALLPSTVVLLRFRGVLLFVRCDGGGLQQRHQRRRRYPLRFDYDVVYVSAASAGHSGGRGVLGPGALLVLEIAITGWLCA